MPFAGQDSIYFLWSGINDVTAKLPTSKIIDSLKRNVLSAKLDGFRVVLLTLTPVASAGDSMAYGYDAAQQVALATINAWILDEGARLSDVVDLNEIAAEYPEFGDPTDSTYYVAGDGLHHNDAGRALIAAKVAAEVIPPEVP
jgi:hypothetical protein